MSSHALLWNGTAESVVDLHPTGFTETYANAVSGAVQVGSGSGPATNDLMNALLWNGTAESAVNLNPAFLSFSEALGASTAGQVGDGFGDSTEGNYHAIYWNNSAESAVDLHSSLANLGAFVASSAKSISDNGMIVGTATDDNFITYAVLWVPTSNSGLLGDYDNSGVVDAADYVLWRKHNNTMVTLPNDSTPGTDADDYLVWRSNYGESTGQGLDGSSSPVPEPATAALYILGALAICAHRCHR